MGGGWSCLRGLQASNAGRQAGRRGWAARPPGLRGRAARHNPHATLRAGGGCNACVRATTPFVDSSSRRERQRACKTHAVHGRGRCSARTFRIWSHDDLELSIRYVFLVTVVVPARGVARCCGSTWPATFGHGALNLLELLSTEHVTTNAVACGTVHTLSCTRWPRSCLRPGAPAPAAPCR
jgi:hypothetical protein